MQALCNRLRQCCGLASLVGLILWCACTPKQRESWLRCRWKEAAEAGKAPPVVLAATHERALEMVSLELLKQHATGE